MADPEKRQRITVSVINQLQAPVESFVESLKVSLLEVQTTHRAETSCQDTMVQVRPVTISRELVCLSDGESFRTSLRTLLSWHLWKEACWRCGDVHCVLSWCTCGAFFSVNAKALSTRPHHNQNLSYNSPLCVLRHLLRQRQLQSVPPSVS